MKSEALNSKSETNSKLEFSPAATGAARREGSKRRFAGLVI
ncbi:MAG: hypothetical protein UV78_C0006G0009 [Parcubacteria group bacterium GW2011_GWA2_43_17]|nr:MAG: hypothetical protein UV78_C0006G0009 [Parcubacteria group bacterium GW2011_GWA2_43_17]